MFRAEGVVNLFLTSVTSLQRAKILACLTHCNTMGFLPDE